ALARATRALTSATGPGTGRALMSLAFLPAIARRDLLFARVLAGGLLDHLAHHVAVAGHEAGDLLEAGAVPHLELDHARAFVVGATRLDRGEEPAGAELLDPRLGEVQVLETPAQLLGRHHLALAELVLRDAQRFDDDDPVHDTARVHHVAEARLVLEVA